MTQAEIIEIVSRHAALTPEQILSNKKNSDIVLARCAAIYFCRQYVPMHSVSLARLSRDFNFAYSTSTARVLNRADSDQTAKAFIRQCESEIKAKAETAGMQVPNG